MRTASRSCFGVRVVLAELLDAEAEAWQVVVQLSSANEPRRSTPEDYTRRTQPEALPLRPSATKQFIHTTPLALSPAHAPQLPHSGGVEFKDLDAALREALDSVFQDWL